MVAATPARPHGERHVWKLRACSFGEWGERGQGPRYPVVGASERARAPSVAE